MVRWRLMPIAPPSKYARWEIERRFLLRDGLPDGIDVRTPSDIADRYIIGGRLRLRRMQTGGEIEYKFCKKYPTDRTSAGLITNVYLTRDEYAVLAALPGHDLLKRRYRIDVDGQTFAIDVFGGALEGVVLIEVETTTPEASAAIAPPHWAGCEVTDDVTFTGGHLAVADPTSVRDRLSALARGAPSAHS